MSRKVDNTPIAKVTISAVEPPSINAFTKTLDFALEAFQKPLHLANAQPTHSFTNIKEWYTGVELEVIVQVVNIRFQSFKNAVLILTVLNNGIEIQKSQTNIIPEIQPQKTLTHIIRFRPLKPGDVVIKSSFKFTFDSNNNEIHNQSSIRIKPAFSIETRTGSSESQRIEVKMKNEVPLAVSNVFLTGPNGEFMEVSKRIEPGDIFLGILKMNGISKDITLNWDLPFSQKCSQKAQIAQAARLPVYPLSFEFLNVPKTIKCYKPFKAIAKISNHEKVPLSGKAEIQAVQKGIFPFGPTQFDIPSVSPGSSVEIEMEFVGLVQGEYHLPPISVTILHLPAFQITPEEGVILVGTGDDE